MPAVSNVWNWIAVSAKWSWTGCYGNRAVCAVTAVELDWSLREAMLSCSLYCVEMDWLFAGDNRAHSLCKVELDWLLWVTVLYVWSLLRNWTGC